MVDKNKIHGIMVVLMVDGEQSLFIMLDANGSINRMGTGSVTNTETEMFIGLIKPDLFREVRDKITPELWQWVGQSMVDPHPQGATCELTVVFKMVDLSEEISAWKYGSTSTGPAAEVAQFVVSVVKATDPWYAHQKEMIEGRRA